MKRIILSIILSGIASVALSQDYAALGDSCFKVQNFISAAKYYDLFLEKVESRSNMIAFKSAKSWSLTGNHEKALTAVKKYVSNNYLNDVIIFSNELTSEKSFDILKNDTDWKLILAQVIEKESVEKYKEKKKIDSVLAYQDSLEANSILKKLDLENGKPSVIYQRIKKFNNYPKINKQLISMQFKLPDNRHTAFLVVLPKDYDQKRRYPLLFFLHGAVRMNTGFPDYADERDTTGWNRFYTKYASINKVIMVYPLGNREYNWMVPDKGFYMVPSMLKHIKELINIDDDRIFISGHSNGATGSFSYAVKQPSPFAGFYGFNTRPQVATGGTYPRNLLNRSFFNISTDEDYYYPPAANDSLTKIMKKLGADYQDHRYLGFPHWFPAFNESEDAHKLLFEDLISRKRISYNKLIDWECDDVKYGRCDWIAITSLDTITQQKNFQKPINFDINKWILMDEDDKVIVKDTTLKAYKYTKISGAIKATYKSNIFHVETSRVKTLRVYISPEMVDIKKNVKIYVNGKLLFNQKIPFDKTYMVNQFKDNIDRSVIWINDVNISI